jgi:malonyl CoA-acyl carrier protein transacylase
MPPIAALLPGQRSLLAGVRELVMRARSDLPAVLDLIDDDPHQHVDETTRPAQPAMFCASLAGWARAVDQIAAPVASAGHAPGALTALAAAGDEQLVAHAA